MLKQLRDHIRPALKCRFQFKHFLSQTLEKKNKVILFCKRKRDQLSASGRLVRNDTQRSHWARALSESKRFLLKANNLQART